MLRTVVPRAILAIVTAARAVGVGDVVVRRAVGSRAWVVEVLHVERQVVGLRAGESGRVVDAEELVEEAGAFAALDVAAAAAGVGIGVERHWALVWSALVRRLNG